jgi:hypothetical protein
LFGPTSPRLWGPLNRLAAALEPQNRTDDVGNRRIEDIAPARVLDAVRAALTAR